MTESERYMKALKSHPLIEEVEYMPDGCGGLVKPGLTPSVRFGNTARELFIKLEEAIEEHLVERRKGINSDINRLEEREKAIRIEIENRTGRLRELDKGIAEQERKELYLFLIKKHPAVETYRENQEAGTIEITIEPSWGGDSFTFYPGTMLAVKGVHSKLEALAPPLPGKDYKIKLAEHVGVKDWEWGPCEISVKMVRGWFLDAPLGMEVRTVRGTTWKDVWEKVNKLKKGIW